MNTLRACPMMPYHDPNRPYVRAWFASAEDAHVEQFNARLSERKQERLEAEGGACFMHTHLASGFCRDGALDACFRELMERISRRNGWFVPVGTLLGHPAASRGVAALSPPERAGRERRWLRGEVRVGHS